MKITYLDHSGFFIEMASHCLLFDYYRGEIPMIVEKPLYVFVSHAHQDHYQESIFTLRKYYHEVHYILSDDIVVNSNIPFHSIAPEKELNVKDVQIKTLTSTDEGVAFLVHVEGKSIYHAGDLHWWYWEEENTPEENQQAKQAYFTQLHKLAQETIDVAFVVVDPRQEDQFADGLCAFLQASDAPVVFPMHIWGDYGILKELQTLPQLQPYLNRIQQLHHTQEEFEV